jgi:chaperonin GroES
VNPFPAKKRLTKTPKFATIEPVSTLSMGVLTGFNITEKKATYCCSSILYQEEGSLSMASDFRVRPLADRVVVKPVDREEVTKGGIFLPDTASKERPQEGLVVAVGEGRRDDSGNIIPMSVQVGDKVLFAKYGGTEFKLDDVEYLILAEKDVLGIVQE